MMYRVSSRRGGRAKWRTGCGWIAIGVLVAGCSTSGSPETTESAGSTPTNATSPQTSTVSPGSSTTAPGSPSDTASTATEDPFVPRTITVVMNGDVLLHDGLWTTAEIDAADTGRGGMDFRPLLSDLKPLVSGADLAVCHMETPLAPRGGPYASYPVFSVPPAIVPALKWTGYDACTTASNHSIDQGFKGLTRTLDYFDEAGIEHAGTAATRRASREPLVMDVNGIQVGLVSATYGTNGIALPSQQPWSVPLIDIARIKRMAARARDEGADIVMVALHWGLEYVHEPTDDQVAIASQLTRSPDIDFVYGHHAHVVQPYDKVNGTWVAYGLGNMVARQLTSVEGVYDGNTCRVTFRERPDGSFRVQKLEYIPTMITPFDGVHPMRVLNVPQDVDDPAFAQLRGQLRATEARVGTVITSLGADKRGVTEGQ